MSLECARMEIGLQRKPVLASARGTEPLSRVPSVTRILRPGVLDIHEYTWERHPSADDQLASANMSHPKIGLGRVRSKPLTYRYQFQ